MNIARWLERAARLHPASPAIAMDAEPCIDYRSFALHAGRGATWLRLQGIAPGDRVALFMENRPDYLELMWAVWWAGAVVVPIDVRTGARDAAGIAAHCGCRLVFCDEDDYEALRQALRPRARAVRLYTTSGFMLDARHPCATVTARGDDDPAWLSYTGGAPRAVLAARHLRAISAAYLASVRRIRPGDAMVHTAPLSRVDAVQHVACVLRAGLNVVRAVDDLDADRAMRHRARAAG